MLSDATYAYQIIQGKAFFIVITSHRDHFGIEILVFGFLKLGISSSITKLFMIASTIEFLDVIS